MDISRIIHSNKYYQDWSICHPRPSLSLDDYAYKVSNSQEFLKWISSNPNGTLDQYISILEQQKQAYYNSPQYQIRSLKSIIETKDNYIQDLDEQIKELKSELFDKAAEIRTYQTTNMITASISLALSIVVIVLGHRIKKYKNKATDSN